MLLSLNPRLLKLNIDTVSKSLSIVVSLATMAQYPGTPVVPLKEAHRFIKDCLEAVGTPTNHATALADVLVQADYRGHYSHGMNRLGLYLSEIQNKVCDPKAVPKILKETPATAWVDGQSGLGVVVGNFSMALAIKKAKTVGVGWVVAKNSNHYGIAGKYALQALDEGLIGMSLTNTSPVVAPTRANQGAIGTNPLALAAPGLDGDSFVLDMATSAVAMGKIEMQKRKNLPIPKRWCLDNGILHPLGGDEEGSSYKGTGLAMMVEILCGILGGATYGPNVRIVGDFSKIPNLGQCFVAIDPKCFADGFEGRLSDLMNSIRSLQAVDPEKSVLVAGDPERQHMAKVDKIGGLCYVEDQLETCRRFAEQLQVKPLLE